MSGLRRALSRDAVVASIVAAVVVLIGLIPRIFSPWFYYWDDMLQSFVPGWRRLGQRLMAGELPLLEPSAWMGGNPIAEAGYGVWNPLNIVDFLIATWVDDMPAFALFVALQYLVALAVGSYFLCREYGARTAPAALAAIAIPFSGFTLFYEATRWPGGLQAFAGVVVFWVFARRFSRGRDGPLAMMITGFVVVTFGNPYGALGMIIVLGGIAIELLVLKRGRRLWRFAAAGAVSGSAGVLVFLPLLLVSPVGWRRQGGVENNGFLVPSLGDLIGMSSPSYQPDVQNWWGPIDASPSTYLAFFLLPLIPWLRWSVLKHRARHLTSLYAVGGTYLLLTVGPSNAGMFRWPIRFIEYFYIAVLVVFAVLLSRGIHRDHVRSRLLGTALITLGGAYLAYAVFPGRWKWHVVLAIMIFLLVSLAVLALLRRRADRAAIVLTVGVAASLVAQAWMFLPSHPAAPRDVPVSAAVLEAAGEGMPGATLILSDPGVAVPPVVRTGALIYGNMVAVSMPDTGMNRYTGLGFEAFADALCMDYRGGVCPEAYDLLWEEVENTDVMLIDALGVDALIVADSYRAVDSDSVPAGWEISERDSFRTVLTRTESPHRIGSASSASHRVEAVASEQSDDSLRETVEVKSEGGTLVFRRLAWPGYQVQVDGRPARMRASPVGLLSVEVPPGVHTVAIEYRTPGLTLGVGALAVGSVAGLALLFLNPRRGRRGLSHGPRPTDHSVRLWSDRPR